MKIGNLCIYYSVNICRISFAAIKSDELTKFKKYKVLMNLKFAQLN